MFTKILLFVFILRLTHNKYYIGLTDQPEKQIQIELDGKGEIWTQVFKPVEVMNIQQVDSPFDINRIVFEYMYTHGIENVRGGIYYQSLMISSEYDSLQAEMKIFKKKYGKYLVPVTDENEQKYILDVDIINTGMTNLTIADYNAIETIMQNINRNNYNQQILIKKITTFVNMIDNKIKECKNEYQPLKIQRLVKIKENISNLTNMIITDKTNSNDILDTLAQIFGHYKSLEESVQIQIFCMLFS